MTYIFDLEAGLKPPFSDALSTEIVEFTLGYDLSADVAIVMSVMLVPTGLAHDLRFGIREKSLRQSWKISGPDYTTQTVRRYIPRQLRGAILAKIAEAIQALLNGKRPRRVTMETYYAGLHMKAMAKYDVVAATIIDCGYSLSSSFRDADTLKNHWAFTRA